MKYILTYNEQFNQDLLYMFPKMQIKYYISHIKVEGCKSWEALEKEDWEDTILIICDLKINQNIYKKMIEQFCIDGKYIWGEEFVKQLDNNLIESYVKGRELIFWGIGKTWKNFREKYPYLKGIYVDSNSQEKNVLLPKQISNWSNKFIIVTSIYYDEIANELKSYDLEEYKDFISCFELWNQPSKLFLSMQDAQKYYNIKCMDPFSMVKIIGNGDVFYCSCENWTLKIGNVISFDYDELESGIYAKLMRLSVLNRTYYFCKKEGGCSLFDTTLYPKGTCELDERRLELPKKIKKQLVAAFDESCNLKCESCRKKYIIKSENMLLPKVTEEIENKILPYMQGAIIATSGEFFLSEYYRKLVLSSNFNRVEKLLILTNGILCNEENWQLLRNAYYGEIQMLVSIDAASEKIYKKVRNGNFNILLKSLEFIKHLREKGEIKRLGINFVIQRENAEDMESFVELGKKIGADTIYFGHLVNWGTFSETEFEKRNMFIGSSRRHKEELSELKELCCNKIEEINWLKINENFRIRGFHENGMDTFE